MIVTGGFRTTALAALQVEAFIPPVSLKMRFSAVDALLRLRSTPAHQDIQDAGRPPSINIKDPASIRSLLSPLEWLEQWAISAGHIRQQDVRGLETRLPFPCPPWWVPTEILIEDREQAKATEISLRTEPGTLRAYTDGSGKDLLRGSSAYFPQTQTTRKAFHGGNTQYTVYAAELYGILMAVSAAVTLKSQGTVVFNTLRIFTDNQAAIISNNKPQQQSGQYIIRDTAAILSRLSDMGVRTVIHWIPAHEDVEGNEEADRLAREATSSLNCPPQIPGIAPCQVTLRTSLRTGLKQRMLEDWATEWKDTKHGKELRKIFPRPTRALLRLHSGLQKPVSSCITQLHTGKIGLGHYLHRIGARESALCECELADQTVLHVLKGCPSHRIEQFNALSVRDILRGRKTAPTAAKHMIQTKLLGQFGAVNPDSIILHDSQQKPVSESSSSAGSRREPRRRA